MEKWEKEILENNKKVAFETKRINDEILQVPEYITENEKTTNLMDNERIVVVCQQWILGGMILAKTNAIIATQGRKN